ncbi:intestine-specific homeobox-like [Haliotis rufescens]|uniref:intestine-specific homeobox-like n=1 Tax=Haliotis rufescens TaxID=6454 RepID=UPI00201F789E|nr:intestine-specific homeobox-like [Haliotis rufescens]
MNGDSLITGITPKRTSAIVQPMPRRLVPMNPRPPTADDSGGSDSTLPSPESSPEQGHLQRSPTRIDLPPRRNTAFSVNDLLGRTGPMKPEVYPSTPVFPGPACMPRMHPYPTYPAAHVFPNRITDARKNQDISTLCDKEAASPRDDPPKRIPSPTRPRRSLTSSPESPISDSSISDPNSSTDRDSSPHPYKTITDKKSNRTNYTPMQVRQLEKIFLETPYPEHEVYEQLSKDLSIPEPRLKVWFQNKRARCKRRAEDKIAYPTPYPFPMMPMAFPYGMMTGALGSPPESTPQSIPKSMFPYAASPSPLMMYPGAGYPSHLYPYLHPQMYVQQ